MRIQKVCDLDINAYGLDDANNAHTSWIKVNGDTVQTATYPTLDNPVHVRGINTILLDPKTCATSDPKTFDTCGDDNAATAFANYIKGLKTGTVVVTTTSDEPQQKLTNAVSTLDSLGVDVSKLNYRGKITFVTEIGSKDKTISSVLPAGGNNLLQKVYVKGDP